MIQSTRTVRRFLLTSTVALALPMSAFAQEAPPPAPPVPQTAPAHQHPHQHPHGERMMKRGPHGPGAHGMLDQRTLRKLELSAKQREEVRSLFEKSRDERRSQLKALREARHGLRQLVISGQSTPQRAETMSKDIAGKESELLMAMAAQGNQVYQILTPAQRSKLAQMKPEREAPPRR